MSLQALRTRFEPVLRRGFHLYRRFARGMTLGVRGMVLDSENRVFLAANAWDDAERPQVQLAPDVFGSLDRN